MEAALSSPCLARGTLVQAIKCPPRKGEVCAWALKEQKWISDLTPMLSPHE